MRRTLGILLAAVILLTASLGIVWAVVDSRGDQITYTENLLRGDVSAAEGITVDTRYEYQNHMVWFSRHRPAETMEADTEFRYYIEQAQFDRERRYTGIDMSIIDTTNINWDWEVRDLADDSGLEGLMKAYYDLYHGTEQGELTNTYIRYADYCEYYPLQIYVDGGKENYGYWDPYTVQRYGDYDEDIGKVFNDYFKIPVMEDDWVQVVIDKRSSGYASESVDITNSRKGKDYCQISGCGTATEDAIYFTFNATTNSGRPIDTSLIPGGYGLYALDQSGEGVDYESLRTLRPLDESFYYMDMWVDEVHNYLMVQMEKEDIWYLSVIDLETGSYEHKCTLQSLGIYGSSEHNMPMAYDAVTGLIYCLFTSNGSFHEMLTFDPATAKVQSLGQGGMVEYDPMEWVYNGPTFSALLIKN